MTTKLDMHVHLDLGTDLAQVVEDARKLKCRLAVSALGPAFHMPGNEAVADALQKYPDTVIGMGYVALGRDKPGKVKELRKQGFRGLKVTCPLQDYDDKALYPIYAQAEDLRMPILFHTGVVARMDIWAQQRGWTEMKNIDFRKLDISSNRMRPICLDAIARAFPGLNLIMAHYCSLGRRDEAASVLKHNPNVYADLTYLSSVANRTQAKEKATLLKSITEPAVYGKLIFGTDMFTSGGAGRLVAGLKAGNLILDELKVSAALRGQIMGGRAQELLGISP